MDVSWAHVLQQSSAMGNPHDFREAMKAAFGFTDRSVDDVLAEQKARDARPARSRGSKSPPPRKSAEPRLSEIDKLNQLLANAKPKVWTEPEPE